MTQRERHTPDDAPLRETIRTPSAGRSGSSSSPGPAPPALGDASRWAEWYHRASPAQQQDALNRAVREGILYSHELAAPTHSAASRRSLLSTLLNGQIKELGPLYSPALECHDRELDPVQRDAVARAVATPDVCLIQGFPGTGKSRVVSEIILQAAQRGERILFLASTTAALDRVLERLGTRPTVCPIRCLAPEETATSLPAGIARLTLPERLRSYQENTVPAARVIRDAARQTLDARLHEQPAWTRLEELAQQGALLAERVRILTERRDAGPPRTETLERLDSQLAGLRAELDTIAGKQGHVEEEWERIRPLTEARQGHRFWTAAWWSGLMRSDLAEQVRDLETRRAELQAARQRLEQDIAARLAERAEIEDRCAAELDAEIAVVSREQDALREKWRTACQTLTSESAPAEISAAAVAAARAEWERQRTRDEQHAASAEQWLQAVEEGLRGLPEKLAGCANVVAATTADLPADGHFGDRNGTPAVLFDLLILDEAHQVTESEFAAVARRARRWILVGEPQPEEELATVPRKVLRSAVPRPGFFQRLWQNLHADPHRLPFAWTQRDGRLLCRLRPIPASQEQWVESEPVVDHPDIELRILSVPRQTPQVAEVVFPACTAVGDAKQFIYHELDELAVCTRGRGMYWSETDDDVILQFATNHDGDMVTVVLEEGVREHVNHVLPVGGTGVPPVDGPTWHTCRLEFARAAGWTRERAEQWVAERLGLRTLGRTVLLTVPHRLNPPLARFLSDLLFGGACEPAPTAVDTAFARPPVEFVAVPSLAVGEGRHRAEAEEHRNGGEHAHPYSEHGQTAVSVRAPRLRAVKGGAGLELDLTDDRPLEQLPAELRAVLPREGLVNYLEARALVKRLESLVHDSAFRAACERWQQRQEWLCEHGCASSSAACGCPFPDAGPAVAVMALYPAQVELLRHLIQQTPTLAQSLVPIEVGLPSAFHQRECLLALVSLTRSHTHRAVSYGDHPHVLTQALTRAASGLLLFGDPGTLARRSQWHGALDHLDESAAQREGRLVGQLVQYLQGHGPHPSVFHIQEGSGV
ncbi:MAG TPA: AAA domain-containing protein [Gemmataceae bacterium]|jgi:hypothetical protein